jgi:hypothetical protein
MMLGTVRPTRHRGKVNDGPVTTYEAGQSFSELPGYHHDISANASETKPAFGGFQNPVRHTAVSAAQENGGGNAVIPDLPGPDVRMLPFESDRSLAEGRTHDAAPISALLLVGRKAERYHRRRGAAASLSRGSPHECSGVAAGFGA